MIWVSSYDTIRIFIKSDSYIADNYHIQPSLDFGLFDSLEFIEQWQQNQEGSELVQLVDIYGHFLYDSTKQSFGYISHDLN